MNKEDEEVHIYFSSKGIKTSNGNGSSQQASLSRVKESQDEEMSRPLNAASHEEDQADSSEIIRDEVHYDFEAEKEFFNEQSNGVGLEQFAPLVLKILGATN